MDFSTIERVLICGDRNWDDTNLILDVITKLRPDCLVIQGGARGADSIAKEQAELRGNLVVTVGAKWDKYGKSAGPIRNREMLRICKPQLVVAFHDSITRSKGTKDMIKAASEVGVKVILMSHCGIVEGLTIHTEGSIDVFSTSTEVAMRHR